MEYPLRNEKRHHQSHNESSNIPRGYDDLTQAEISLLTKILSHAPRRKASNSAYEQVVRGLISELPSHLRSKIPWLCSFCSLHKKMNPLPVISILEWLKSEIEECIPDIWTPLRKRRLLDPGHAGMLAMLEDMSALWRPPESFKLKYGRAQQTNPAYEFNSSGCAACILSQVGGNNKELTALGGFFIARVDTTMWKRSKRILWVEAWIRGSVEDNEEENAIHRMWNLGVQLRELRRKATDSSRSYVDEYIKQSTENAEVAQPPTVPYGVERTCVTAYEGKSGLQTSNIDDWLAHATADDVFNGQYQIVESDPFSEKSSPQEIVQGPASVVRTQEASQRVRVPSSFYSRNSDGSPWSEFSSHDTESELIDHYRHSTWSKATSEAAESRDRDSSAAPEPLSQASKDPELAKFPRHKMSPITIPRRRYG